ncbi:MAG TPA: energy-coupling factor transporter ATPase [Candidatus Binatia bacterium]
MTAAAPPQPVPAPPGEPLLELRSVTCRYPDASAPALADVDFTLRAGEIVAVMGHSGAGKSTLLKCLTGIVPRFEHAEVTGERRAFAEPLDHLRPGDLAGRVGMVFQDFEAQIFSTNVALEVGFAPQQLGLPRAEIARRTERALERVGLAGFDARDPATLSGGEKQRLALAGILALEPRVVLLDEPITDIDPEGRRRVLELLRALRDEGVGVLIVEHDVLAAQEADRLVLLAEGRVRADGPSADLLRDTELIAACGVRPRDLDVLALRLGITAPLRDVDEAADVLRRAGFVAHATPDAQIPHAQASTSSADPRAERSPTRAEQDEPPLLELRDVSFRYGDDALALDGVSLRIRAGEMVALVGQNGSGKTTLAKHLIGLLHPSQGAVLLEGRDTRGLSLGDVARRVGFVFQNPDHQLFSASVAEEVAYGPRHLSLTPEELRARVERALAVCGLADRRDDDPFLLRKGERQRLAVASVLAIEPRVLILDEPTTGLDWREQLAILELLHELNRARVTIVVISHSPWLVAEHAQRVVLMARGRVLFDGPVHELLRAEEALRAGSFVLPDASLLGLRFGVAARSVDELAAALARRGTRP